MKDARHGHEVGMYMTETQDKDVRQVGVGIGLANVKMEHNKSSSLN